ncbi:unnamed protein product [Discosporangium mesarthrocarpum]
MTPFPTRHCISTAWGGEQVVLSASSPDDEALVLGAKYFGVEFTDRVDSSAIVQTRKVE